MLPSPRLPLAALAFALLAAGCAPAKQGPSPADYAAPSLASAQQRIRGRWLLVDYAPELALEPVLRLLVQSQLGRLNVTFDGATLVADGPGVHVSRSYRVLEASGDQIKVDVVDCQFAASCRHLRADFRRVMQPPDVRGHAATSERG
jgi:hypothetical protein